MPAPRAPTLRLFADRIIFFPNGLPKLKPKPKTKPKPTRRQKQKLGHGRIGHAPNGTELLSNNIEYQYHDEPNNERSVGGRKQQAEEEEVKEQEDDDDEDDEDSDDDDYDDRIRAEIYSNYPHYLHPPSWGINNPLVLASHSPHTSEDDDVVVEVPTTTHHGHRKLPPVDDLERSVVDDVVVVVDAGPGSNTHPHTHTHTHTYYAHGTDSSSTIGSPTTSSPGYTKYAASITRPGRVQVASCKPATLLKVSHMISKPPSRTCPRPSVCQLPYNFPNSWQPSHFHSLTEPKTLLTTATAAAENLMLKSF